MLPNNTAPGALSALYHAARRTIDQTPMARKVGRLPSALPPVQRAIGLRRPMARALRPIALRQGAELLLALARAAPHLDWRNSYGRDAFGALFLHRSAWAEIAGPQGAFVTEDLRVTFGIWDRALIYDWHAHGPEEVYLPLAGRATISARGRRPADTDCGPVHHRSWLPHRLKMGPAPFVAMAVWRGESLSAVSRLGHRG